MQDLTPRARAVVVKGVLEQDQDFGYGYKYDLIIQDAKVSVEE